VNITVYFIRARSNPILSCSSQEFYIYIYIYIYAVQWKGGREQDIRERKRGKELLGLW